MPPEAPTGASRPELPEALRPLREHRAEAALFLDFDGTLSPIVAEPGRAAPLPGVPAVLGRLAGRFALVAVVSGRPAAFLRHVLGDPPGVRLAGLYGMEVMEGDGRIVTPPEIAGFREIIAELTAEARAGAPDGAGVEDKGLTVTLHWRNAPAAEGWARRFARDAKERTGVRAEPGRMSLELQPPVAADKGTVVRAWAPGHRALGCFGDDLGDLPAFAAVGHLAASGVAVVRVAVVDAESPPEVAAAADLSVAGPEGALELLELLAS